MKSLEQVKISTWAIEHARNPVDTSSLDALATLPHLSTVKLIAEIRNLP